MGKRLYFSYQFLEMIRLFDKRFALTGAAIILVTAFSFVMSNMPIPPETAAIAEDVSGIDPQNIQANELSQSSLSEEFEAYAYLIKEHNGRIAVFESDNDEPELVLNILVKYLPDYDRGQMKQGITVKDYDELVKLLEDYDS